MGRVVLSSLRAVPRIFSSVLRRIPGFVGRVFQSVLRAARGVLGRLPGTVSAIFRGAGRWFAPLVFAVTRILGGRGVIMGILRALGPRAAAILGGPAGWVAGLLSLLATPFTRFVTYWNMELIPRYVAMFKALFGPRSMLLSEVENFRQTLYNMPIFGGIFRQAGRLGEWLRGWVGSLGAWAAGAFERIGRSVVFGWLWGIARDAHRIWQYLTDLARRAWEAVRSFFESRSPSERMYREARNHIDGWVKAYREGAGRLGDAAREAARAAASGFSDADFSREPVGASRTSTNPARRRWSPPAVRWATSQPQPTWPSSSRPPRTSTGA